MSKLNGEKKQRCPRVFVRWFEDNGDTIAEYHFDVNSTLQEAQKVAKHLAEFMDYRGIEYMSCYATTLYLS